MLLKDAITYLENESVDVRSRFNVLTGFNTQENSKDQGRNYWFNDLYKSDVFQKLEQKKAFSNMSSFFSTLTASVLSAGLETKLKNAYKKASTQSEEQNTAQEDYIQLIVAYLKENQTVEPLASFVFAYPECLLSKQVVVNQPSS